MGAKRSTCGASCSTAARRRLESICEAIERRTQCRGHCPLLGCESGHVLLVALFQPLLELCGPEAGEVEVGWRNRGVLPPGRYY